MTDNYLEHVDHHLLEVEERTLFSTPRERQWFKMDDSGSAMMSAARRKKYGEKWSGPGGFVFFLG